MAGDISKMYHRVLIPERYQQVNRYLWRNMETEREPDVYAKTVLTKSPHQLWPKSYYKKRLMKQSPRIHMLLRC